MPSPPVVTQVRPDDFSAILASTPMVSISVFLYIVLVFFLPLQTIINSMALENNSSILYQRA